MLQQKTSTLNASTLLKSLEAPNGLGRGTGLVNKKSKQSMMEDLFMAQTTRLIIQYRKLVGTQDSFLDVCHQFFRQFFRQAQESYVQYYAGIVREGKLNIQSALNHLITHFRQCSEFILKNLSVKCQKSLLPSSNPHICQTCTQIIASRNIELQKARLHTGQVRDPFNMYCEGLMFQQQIQNPDKWREIQCEDNQKQVYVYIGMLGKRIQSRIGEIMGLVDQIRKYGDQEYLCRYMKGKNDKQEKQQYIKTFDSCYRQVLLLLQQKLQKMLKSLKPKPKLTTQSKQTQTVPSPCHSDTFNMQKLDLLSKQLQNKTSMIQKLLKRNQQEQIRAEHLAVEAKVSKERVKDMQSQVQEIRSFAQAEKARYQKLMDKYHEKEADYEMLSYQIRQYKTLNKNTTKNYQQETTKLSSVKNLKRSPIKKVTKSKKEQKSNSTKDLQLVGPVLKQQPACQSQQKYIEKDMKEIEQQVESIFYNEKVSYSPRRDSKRDSKRASKVFIGKKEKYQRCSSFGDTMQDDESNIQPKFGPDHEIDNCLQNNVKTPQFNQIQIEQKKRYKKKESQESHWKKYQMTSQNIIKDNQFASINEYENVQNSPNNLQKQSQIQIETQQRPNEVSLNGTISKNKYKNLPQIIQKPKQKHKTLQQQSLAESKKNYLQKLQRLTAPINVVQSLTADIQKSFNYDNSGSSKSKQIQKLKTLCSNIQQKDKENYVFEPIHSLTRGNHRNKSLINCKKDRERQKSLLKQKIDQVSINQLDQIQQMRPSINPIPFRKIEQQGGRYRLNKYKTTIKNRLHSVQRKNLTINVHLMNGSNEHSFQQLINSSSLETGFVEDAYREELKQGCTKSLQVTNRNAAMYKIDQQQVFNIQEVQNLYLCIQSALRHQKWHSRNAAKIKNKQLQVSSIGIYELNQKSNTLLKPHQFKYITKILTLIAVIHSFSRVGYRAVKNMLLHPYSNIIMQQDYLNLKSYNFSDLAIMNSQNNSLNCSLNNTYSRSSYTMANNVAQITQISKQNQGRLKEALSSVIILHRICKQSSQKKGFCKHLLQFAKKLEIMCGREKDNSQEKLCVQKIADGLTNAPKSVLQ